MSAGSDFRYGARQLWRTPAFALVAILALGIGVGANITIFLFVNQWLLRPIDGREPARLIRVTGPGGDSAATMATENEAHLLPRDYLTYREQNQSFTSLAAGHIGGPMRMRTTGPPQMVPVTVVTGNYFETLGVPAALGRALRADDGKAGATPVIVLSDVGWRRFFDARPDVVGSTAFLDGEPATIVGVLPAWFAGTSVPMVPQIYRPLIEQGANAFPLRVQVIGRLKPGVTRDQARADLTRIASALSERDGQRRPIEIYTARSVMPFMLRGVALLALIFGLIVGVVLLIACDNIAIFMAIRAAARMREIGIRVALGATRGRLIGQLLAESAIVSIAGGVIGLACAYLTATFASRFYLPTPMPFALTFTMDWRVVVFALVMSGAGTMLCGLAPARRALAADVLTAPRASIPASGIQPRLVVTQATLSTVLLVTAAVLGRSLMTTVARPTGFSSAGVVMSTLPLSGAAYTPQRRQALLDTLLERLQRAPDVSSATIVDTVPLANNTALESLAVRSGERTAPASGTRVSRGFFQTLGIPLLAGRDFEAGDDANPESVGIVNDTLARRLWPGESPIGKQLRINERSTVAIVGVSRDTKYVSLNEPPTGFVYRPISRTPVATPTFLIKTTGDPTALLAYVRARIAELDPDLVAFNLMTLDERLTLGLVVNRAAAAVSGSLGLLALGLGSFGLYGTMSFLVQLRRREIGVRLALGASARDVMRLMARQGMRWAGTGLLLGVVVAWLVALGLTRALSGVTAADPLAFIAAPLALGAAAYLACAVPARGAASVDPAITLREE